MIDPRTRLAAVEVLLTDPEELHMDPLEGPVRAAGPPP